MENIFFLRSNFWGVFFVNLNNWLRYVRVDVLVRRYIFLWYLPIIVEFIGYCTNERIDNKPQSEMKMAV